jgi:hypothetical protein
MTLSRIGDLLASLVGIYGGIEPFVAAYKQQLAERLIGLANSETEGEERTLELLKKRFGEESLVECEIMVRLEWPWNVLQIRDLHETRRALFVMRDSLNYSTLPDAMRGRGVIAEGADEPGVKILSAHYWPSAAIGPASQRLAASNVGAVAPYGDEKEAEARGGSGLPPTALTPA